MGVLAPGPAGHPDRGGQPQVQELEHHLLPVPQPWQLLLREQGLLAQAGEAKGGGGQVWEFTLIK